MALVGVELETLGSEPDVLTTRPPPCAAMKTIADSATVTVSMASSTNFHLIALFIGSIRGLYQLETAKFMHKFDQQHLPIIF